jgi:hypothetical protein
VKNEAKKRSLHGVNEHFELNFDDVSASAVVFQRAVMTKMREHVCGHGADIFLRVDNQKWLVVSSEISKGCNLLGRLSLLPAPAHF